MRLLITLAVVGVLISVIEGQTFNIGKCPASVSVKQDFDLSQYVGTWYEATKNRRYWIIMDSGLKCTTETYTLIGNDTIEVINKGRRILNNRDVTVRGTGRLISPGKFAFDFHDLTFSPHDVPYWVLDTDYTSYAVVWSCSDRSGVNAQISWILTREPKPDPSVIRKATSVLSQYGLGRSSMVPTLHNNCKDELHQKFSNTNSNQKN